VTVAGIVVAVIIVFASVFQTVAAAVTVNVLRGFVAVDLVPAVVTDIAVETVFRGVIVELAVVVAVVVLAVVDEVSAAVASVAEESEVVLVVAVSAAAPVAVVE